MEADYNRLDAVHDSKDDEDQAKYYEEIKKKDGGNGEKGRIVRGS